VVSGVDVNVIVTDNIRIVDDAFTYRLVWALEAIRTRRLSLGWSLEIAAGGAAATPCWVLGARALSQSGTSV
jgi:hypothetical protein